MVPEARIEMGPFPRFFEARAAGALRLEPVPRRLLRLWPAPGICPDDLHLIMQIMDRMNTDESYHTLTNQGIEGKHWEINEFGYPERREDFIGIDASKQIGARLLLGRTLQLYSAHGELAAPRRPQGAGRLPQEPGRHLLRREHPPGSDQPVLSDHRRGRRRPVGKMDVSGQMNVLFVELITGAKDLAAFDEWMARWEEAATFTVVEQRMNEINLRFQ